MTGPAASADLQKERTDMSKVSWIARGGLGLAENCLHLCFECHEWVHRNAKVSYGHGALIRRHMTSHPEPVFHLGWRTCTVDHVHGGVDTAA